MNNPKFRDLVRSAQGPQHFTTYQISLLCPHCNHFTPAFGALVGSGTKSFLVECHQCHEAIALFVNNPNQLLDITPDMIVDYYPKNKVTVDSFVPSAIAEDYLEAQRCFSVGAWQACCVMARRCLHHIADQKKAEGNDLYDQIEDLRNKGLVSALLAETAQKVRVLGKHGAHPFDFKGNWLTDIDTNDAAATLEFCEYIFNELYIQPGKLNAINPGKRPPVEGEAA